MAERWIEEMIARNSVPAPALAKTADAPTGPGICGTAQAITSPAPRARRKSKPRGLTPISPPCPADNDTARLPAQPPAKRATAPSVPVTFAFANVASEPVEWLWPGWVPMGKVTVMVGAGDLGKSLLLLDLAARISTTGVMPDGSQGCAGTVVIVSGQDGARDTVRPRLEAAVANLDSVISMTHVLEGERERSLELQDDLSHVEGTMQKHDPRLLILDPLLVFGAQAGKVLGRLGKAAEKQRCAIVCVIPGNGILGQARAGLVAAQDPDDEGLRILSVSKSNLAVKPQSLKWKIEPAGAVCRVAWLGASPYTASQLSGPPPTKAVQEAKEDLKQKVHQAKELLRGILKWGRKPARECKKLGADGGFSARTMERAARELELVVTIERDYMTDGRRFMWAPKDWRGGEVVVKASELTA
jgi:hypothetical protein